MAKMIKTFPVIQCSPPSGKPAKATSPRLQGKKWPRSTGSHSLGPRWGQQGDRFCPAPHWPGREETTPEPARTRRRAGPHAHTHPRTNTCSTQASFGLTEQEKEAARDHTLGGGEAISGSHWAEKLPRNTWILQLGVNTVDATRVSGTNPEQAFTEGEFLMSFSLLCLHYNYGQIRVLDVMLMQWTLRVIKAPDHFCKTLQAYIGTLRWPEARF